MLPRYTNARFVSKHKYWGCEEGRCLEKENKIYLGPLVYWIVDIGMTCLHAKFPEINHQKQKTKNEKNRNKEHKFYCHQKKMMKSLERSNDEISNAINELTSTNTQNPTGQ